MDAIIQLPMGTLICCWGIYLVICGYKTTVLRQEVLIFPVRWIIWVGRILFGRDASDRFKEKQYQPKTMMVDGYTRLITGMITLVLGVWLVIEAFEKLVQ